MRRLRRRLARRVMDRLIKMFYEDVPNEYRRRYILLIRRISMKTRVKPPSIYRLFICKGCKKPLIPGENAIYRLYPRPYKHIYIKCLECGHVYRRGYDITKS